MEIYTLHMDIYIYIYTLHMDIYTLHMINYYNWLTITIGTTYSWKYYTLLMIYIHTVMMMIIIIIITISLLLLLLLLLSLLLTSTLILQRQAARLRTSKGGRIRLENPHRAQIYQFELFELVLLSKLDNQFHVEQFEATVSQSTVPSPLLNTTCLMQVSSNTANNAATYCDP